MKYIAHRDQELYEHLEGVARLAKIHAEKICMGNYGELLGLLHDVGKYSEEFQKYITDALKKEDPAFNPDEDEEFEDLTGKRGKIDHSTAGAQILSCNNGLSNAHKILGQILSLCFGVASLRAHQLLDDRQQWDMGFLFKAAIKK